MRHLLLSGGVVMTLAFCGCSKPSTTPPAGSGTTGSTGTSMTKPSSGVEGTNWRLVELDGTPIAYTGEKSPSLQLDAATKRFSGSGGCNHIMGGYTLEGGTLHFSQAAATRMACLEGMETEGLYLQALNVVDTYRVLDGKLELMQADRVRARFEPVRP